MSIRFCGFCGTEGLSYQPSNSAYRCDTCTKTQYKNSKPAVCAVILRGDLVLLVKNSSPTSQWDLPGGFLLHGESPEDGLRREIDEEISARIEIKRLLTAVVEPYGLDQEFSLNLFFEVVLVSNELQAANEISQFAWFPLNDLPSLEYEGTHQVLLHYRNGKFGAGANVPDIMMGCVSGTASTSVALHESVPWSSPAIDNQELQAVVEVFRSGWLTMGPKTINFEASCAEFLGAKHAIAVSNGSVALDLAMAALEIEAGDEVAVPAIGYIATVAAVLRRGAVPIFVDVEPDTFNMSPTDLISKITSRTKCIIYMDYGGIPAESDRILDVGRANNVFVLQDSAQSLGATKYGRNIGFDTGLSTLSFHASKLATTIEGGMILVDDPEMANRLRQLRNQGEDPLRKYHHPVLGFNARLTDIQAAIGLVQLRKLPLAVTKRRILAEQYFALLQPLEKYLRIVQCQRPGYNQSWFFYSVLVDKRDDLAAYLRSRAIAPPYQSVTAAW